VILLIPDFLDEETLELIDRLLLDANSNLQQVMNKLMPHRSAQPHWTFLMGIGIFVHNYKSARLTHGYPIEESVGFALNFCLENPEIQHNVAKIMALGAHKFAMGGDSQ
jgi:hypothetical protein